MKLEQEWIATNMNNKTKDKRLLPDKFYDNHSDILKRIRHERFMKYGIFGNVRKFREQLTEPYDPTSLQEDYYFGRANQRLVS